MTEAPEDAILETPRLWLRPWREDDLDAFFAMWSDPRVIFWGPDREREASRDRLQRIRAATQGGLGYFAAVARSPELCPSEPLVAGLILREPEFGDFPPGVYELGYHLRYDAWGKGIVTEACAGLQRYAVDALGAERLVAVILSTNERSLAVVRRLGFRYAGEQEYKGRWHELWDWRPADQSV